MNILNLRDPAFLKVIGGGGGGPTAGDIAAADWAARVVTNGGAAPGATSIAAQATFYDGLVTDGLLAKFYTLNCYAGDSLIACITPLIVGVGSDPWGNGSFTVTQLSAAGLKGDGGLRWLDTNVNYATGIASANDFGTTIYLSTGANENLRDFGCNDGGYTNVWVCHTSLGTTLSTIDNFSGSNRIAVANSAWAGYLSMNRPDTTHLHVYKANSVTPHATLGSFVGASVGAAPNLKVFLHASNQGGAPAFPCTKTFSFGALHTAMSSAESALLYARVQQLRTDMGGGYV